SNVESKVHDVAFLHDVFLAFEAQTSCLLRALLTLESNEIVVSDDLGADKALLEIRVYLGGRFWRRCTHARRPCPDFLYACGEKRLQPEQPVAAANDSVETGFLHAEVSQEFCLVPFVE